jgi:hypothetical protein
MQLSCSQKNKRIGIILRENKKMAILAAKDDSPGLTEEEKKSFMTVYPVKLQAYRW